MKPSGHSPRPNQGMVVSFKAYSNARPTHMHTFLPPKSLFCSASFSCSVVSSILVLFWIDCIPFPLLNYPDRRGTTSRWKHWDFLAEWWRKPSYQYPIPQKEKSKGMFHIFSFLTVLTHRFIVHCAFLSSHEATSCFVMTGIGFLSGLQTWWELHTSFYFYSYWLSPSWLECT